MKYEIYKSGKEWRWRLKAINGEIIASGEAYVNRKDCLAAIGLVKRSGDASVVRVSYAKEKS